MHLGHSIISQPAHSSMSQRKHLSWTTFESAARGDDREWGVPMIRTVPALAVIAGWFRFFTPRERELAPPPFCSSILFL